MGNDTSAASSSSTTGSTSSTPVAATASASTPGLREEPIILNVYEPAPQSGQQQQQMQVPGFGIYHTGLEVYGTEYSFVGGDSTSSGIQPQPPRFMPPGAPWIYKKTEKIGTTVLTRSQISTLISKMGSEYPNNSYNLLARNCNHFSDDFCKRISKTKTGIPGWVNRTASMANAFFGPAGMPGQPGRASATPPPPPEPSVFTKPGYSLSTGAVVDPAVAAKKKPDTKSSSSAGSGTPAKRKNPWADPHFKPGGKALKDASSSASATSATAASTDGDNTVLAPSYADGEAPSSPMRPAASAASSTTTTV